MSNRNYGNPSLEYPRPAYAGHAGSTGTRTPISPLSAQSSVISLPRPGWSPSAPGSAYGSAPPSPPRRYAQPRQVPQIPQQYRKSTPTRRSQPSRHTDSTSSRESSKIVSHSPPTTYRDTWRVSNQRNTWGTTGERNTWDSAVSRESARCLSEEALRTLRYAEDDRLQTTTTSPTEQAYDRLNGHATRDQQGLYPLVEQKVLIHPRHQATESQNSVVPLLTSGVGTPTELPASTPANYRRSIPLMDAINPRVSMLHGYGTYSSEDFHDLMTPHELAGDSPNGPHELPTTTPQVTSMNRGSDERPSERSDTRNFSRSFAPVSMASRESDSPEKGDWYLHPPSNNRRKKWIIIAIVVLIIIAAIIGGAVGGTAAKKSKKADSSSGT